jgi:hypothetical protein
VSTPLLVPLGRYLGLLPVSDGQRTTLEHVARLGGRRVVLSDDEMPVWALAHGTPGASGLDHWDRAAVRRHAPSEVVDVDGTIDRLIASGLLMEVRDPVEFARAVRLLPQALGLGNSEEQPRAFVIGFPTSPLVVVPTGTFYLWAWACLAPDLWTACQRGEAVSDPPGRTDANGLLTELLGGLHSLLATNAACLDTAVAAA